MSVTFDVFVPLADFGADPRPGVTVRAVATPRVKLGPDAIHSAEKSAVTDEAGHATLTLVSVVGVWYEISSPGAINPVRLAGYVPDVEDPTTGEVFAADVVINLRTVMDEDPTPGYVPIAVYPGGGGGGVTVHGELTGREAADQHPIGAVTGLQAALDAKAAVAHVHEISDVSELDAYLAAVAAALDETLQKTSNLSDLTDAAAARTNLGLGTAATTAVTAYATAAQGAKADTAVQPAALDGYATDAELVAGLATKAPVLGSDDNYVTDAEKAALHTHPAVVAQGATQADARTAIGLGTAATTASTAYATAAQGTKADTALQPATAQTINAQTGTTYTLVAADAGKVVTLSNTGAITLSAPGSVFTAGQRVDVVVINTGMATVVGTSGATANGTPSLVSRARWSAFTVLWTSATACVVIGDLA